MKEFYELNKRKLFYVAGVNFVIFELMFLLQCIVGGYSNNYKYISDSIEFSFLGSIVLTLIIVPLQFLSTYHKIKNDRKIFSQDVFIDFFSKNNFYSAIINTQTKRSYSYKSFEGKIK